MTIPTEHYGWEKPTPGADEDIWGDILNTVFDDIDADLHDLQSSLPLQIPNPCTALFIGASNTLQNNRAVSGSKKTSTAKLRSFNQALGTVGTATLGITPFNTDSTYGVVNSKSFQIGRWAALEKDINFNLIQYGLANTSVTQLLTVANGGPNDNTNMYDAGTTLAPGRYKIQTVVDDALVAFGVEKVNIVHVDTGGIDVLKGILNIAGYFRKLILQLYSEPWASEDMVIIFSEMPPRGSYWDVTNALKAIVNSGEFPRVGLLSTDFIEYIVDEYPESGDVAHYTGASCEDLAPRFWNEYAKLPRFNLGAARNSSGGLGVILSNDPSDGTIPGESEAVPYVASCETDFQVFTANTSKAIRPISYIQLSAVNAARNIRTVFHNYSKTGSVLCLMAPRKPAVDISNITVVGGSNFVIVSYTSYEAVGDPVEGTGFYFSGLTGDFANLNDKLFYFGTVTPSPDPEDYTGTFAICTYPSVFLDGAAWSAETYAPGASFEGLIGFEDPRTKEEVAKVYIFEGETVIYERIGGGDTAPFRVTDFTVNPEFGTKYDPYDGNNRVLNSDFRMLDTNWHTGTKSFNTWEVDDIGTGRFADSRSMTLTDDSSYSNPLYWNERLRVLPGDRVDITFYVKSTVGPAVLSSNRMVLQFFDEDGDEVDAVLGVQNNTIRADFTALSVSAVAPSGAFSAGGYMNLSLEPPGGTVVVSDAVLTKGTTSTRQYATRDEFVTAVAGGITCADGLTTTAEGFNYKWQAGATVIPDLPGLVPCEPAYIEHFGAKPSPVNSREAFAAAGLSERKVNLLSSTTYFVSAPTVEISDNASFESDNTATVLMDLATFINNDRNAYLGSTSALFYTEASNVEFKNFKIRPSVQSFNGRVRIPISNISKAPGENIVVEFTSPSSFETVFSDGQKVTLYGMDGANEIDAQNFVGVANPCEFTIEAYDEDNQSFELSGTTAVVLTPYVSDGYIEPKRFLVPIAISEADGVKSTNVDIAGFTAGYAHAIQSSFNVDIVPNVHDWFTNYCWQDGSEAQQSAVEIDQTKVGGVGSDDIRVLIGTIANLNKGNVAKYQQDNPTVERLQNDGVHGAGHSEAGETPTGSVTIDGVKFDGVDEAADYFGDNLIMTDCQLDNITSHLLKAYYGAQKVIFSNNRAGETGRQSINIASGAIAVTDRDTSVIVISDNVFEGVSDFYASLGIEHAVLKLDDTAVAGYNGITEVYSSNNVYNTGTDGTHCIDKSLRQYRSEFYSNNDAFIKGPGATGYFNRGRFSRIPIVGISKANPGVVTMAPSAEFGMFATTQVVAIYGVGGMTQITDGYYTIGTNPVSGSFELQDENGVNIDTTTFDTFTEGGFVQLGGRVQIVNPKNKTIFKATLPAAQTVAAATLSAVLNFTLFIHDQRDEGSIASKGPVIQIPGWYRVNCAARTTGATPSTVTESTQLQILVTGAGNPLTSFALPRDSEGFTYSVSGIVWCDEGDVITAQVVFTANASGVTFSADHRFTYLSVEMI